MNRLEIPATMASLSRVRRFTQTCAHGAGIASPRAHLLTVAAVEVVSNVVRHAQGMPADATIGLTSQIEGPDLLLKFSYSADCYAPTSQAPCPALPRLASATTPHLPEGGFGLGIIQQAVDELNYRYDNGVNTVQLRVRR